MSDWVSDLLAIGSGGCASDKILTQETPMAAVLITVVCTRGSCPRETGTRMIVTDHISYGTIGGGHLEYQAMDIARELLSGALPEFRIERFTLGARLGQCCGGVVHLSFEFIPAKTPTWINTIKDIQDAGLAAILVSPLNGSTDKLIVTTQTCTGLLSDSVQQSHAAARALELLDQRGEFEPIQEDGLLYEPIGKFPMRIAIFGAGHVGKALVNVLGTMPCHIDWIDSRASEFPERIPGHVCMEITDLPESEVDELPAGSHVVIMTHSHTLDQKICERVLNRNDLGWCGLIGSITKRRQFEKRLLARGLASDALSKLACPIGLDGISGKHPAHIAISVAAQLLLSESTQHK